VNCFDPSDQDQTDERERGNLTVVARVPARLWPEVDAGEVLATPGLRRGHDKDQDNEASSPV
jgi:hypothetical protein